MSTLTVYPDANPESTSVDGYVSYQVVALSGVTWATIIAAADGHVTSDTEAIITRLLFIKSDSVTDRWTDLSRSFFLFDTSALGNGATITSATLSLFGTEKVDTGGITPNINIYSSTPASNTALVLGDYDQVGSTAFSTAITFAGFSEVAYNDFALNASGLANISKTGISKFSTRNGQYDAASVSPTWANTITMYMKCYGADQAGTTNDPKLLITYTQVGNSSLQLLGVGM